MENDVLSEVNLSKSHPKPPEENWKCKIYSKSLKEEMIEVYELTCKLISENNLTDKIDVSSNHENFKILIWDFKKHLSW